MNSFLIRRKVALSAACIGALLVVSEDPWNALWLNKDEREFMTACLAA